MAVFVLDQHKQPLMPCSEKRARLLLSRRRAVVHRQVPFTIRLKDRTVQESAVQSVRIKLDPGSKTTGIALVREVSGSEKISVVALIELIHRGYAIKEALRQRASFRRRRRGNLRYRPARFYNRTKPKGWLAPSLQHRVDSTINWVNRLIRLAPVTAISNELVRFDMQKMQNPEISGIEYQQGTLLGYEVREYLLEKWGRKCAYCGEENTPLEIEHIHPKATGGSNRVSNLTMACHDCNQAKGTLSLSQFFAENKALRRRQKRNGVNVTTQLDRVLKQVKMSLCDAAAVNSARWALWNTLKATNLPVETGTGGQTKYNRIRLELPKTHALDAVCVGEVESVEVKTNEPTLQVKCMGRGSYQRTRLNKYGFPRGYLTRQKQIHGFQTGDLVKAVVTSGKKIGTYVGRVAVRASGNFNIQIIGQKPVQGISYRFCQLIQRSDGYSYGYQPTFL